MQRVTEAHSANAATAKPESRILTWIIRPGTIQRNVGLPLLRLHRLPHRRHDLPARWHDPPERRRAAVDHEAAVHYDLERAVTVATICLSLDRLLRRGSERTGNMISPNKAFLIRKHPQ